ncbi:aminotransferase class I/II-fold pyridoxal phosphate-dependent enzyme [Clostridiales bacterium AF36-10]|nr:aminotransferase class I/II-fold pyridoxal phosphate-dependent enzyme [Clostridium sp. AM25-23AC]RJW86188.1 aminotransferase class I/II-fold pyridoxal phosphate-dependent enzyme [Clostridiales bacterium AF36-10]
MGNRRIKILNYRKEKQPGLLERLTEYAGSDAYPFHMPGHKRREIPDGIPGGFPDPYGIDITEIDGFDNLHHAEGILKDAMDEAAAIYGADRSWYLVNGSTCGILSAVFATTENGGKILTARNCHKAVYHAIYLNRLEAEYLYPEEITEFGINGGIRAEDVRKALEKDAMRCAGNSGDVRGKNTKIQAVLITSPTYEGVVSDIRAIADAAHEYGIPLIVDEAHGAHLEYADQCHSFPKSALEYGADIVIQSLHKTLPCFTQTAILHVKGKFVDQDRVSRYLSMFQTSSPSYLFMAGMERCIRYMDGDGRNGMVRYEERLEHFMERMEGLQVLEVLDREICGKYRTVAGWDPSKIVVSTMRAEDFHGEELAETLRRKYHLEMEMTAPEYVIAMTSLMDTEEGFERLGTALLEIDGALRHCVEPEQQKEKGESKEKERCETPEVTESKVLHPVRRMLICEAMDADTERTAFQDTVGKVSAEFVYLYPPGIPIIAPGEVFTDAIVEKIMAYKAAGLLVQGPADPDADVILTLSSEDGNNGCTGPLILIQ